MAEEGKSKEPFGELDKRLEAMDQGAFAWEVLELQEAINSDDIATLKRLEGSEYQYIRNRAKNAALEAEHFIGKQRHLEQIESANRNADAAIKSSEAAERNSRIANRIAIGSLIVAVLAFLVPFLREWLGF